MKPIQTLSLFAIAVIVLALTPIDSFSQEYKLRQTTGMMGMNSETTIYVKGKRKRTESPGVMGIGAGTTIEQCDLQRTIKINDKKKLYYIEPFGKADEVIEEDVKPAVSKTKPVVTKTEKGGIIHNWYNIRDTGERKKIHGFTARHIWTTQKIKPSDDACTMKDSLIIKTDGWYIDLPEFNCPIPYRPSNPTEYQKPECEDKFVTHRSGKGKLGFPLTETRTIIMGGKTESFTSTQETVEVISMKLDSMLFTIPPGYTETKNPNDLQDKFDMNAYIDNAKNQNKNNSSNNNNSNNSNNTGNTEEKKAGTIRIGVYEPKGTDAIPAAVLQQHLANDLNNGTIEAIPVANEEEAKQKNCDYSLATNFTRVKQANKVGGLIKAIKSADPTAGGNYNIDADLLLTNLSDGTPKLQEKVSGKYEGKPEDAAKKALDDGANKVLKGLK